jgi:hypothetical protein
VTTNEVEDANGGTPGGASGKVRQQPTPKLKTPMAASLRGAGGKVRQRSPPELKTSMVGPREVSELEIRKRSAFLARPSSRAMNGYRNVGTNAQTVVRTYFTLTHGGT